MKDLLSEDFVFPVGYEKFHKKQLYNFQLNRPYSFGYTRIEDLEGIGSRINSFSSWKNEMLKLAEKAVTDKRIMNAAFFYRAAEFYLRSDDSEKSTIYDKFIELFYKAFEEDGIERYQVPYENSFLSAIKIPPSKGKKGTIVLHGGFDSFIEEFYSMMKYFSIQGYEVVGFEGPGQGSTLRNHGIPITIDWENPTKVILDYFSLENVTLIGLSMGGWLCLRAAAFEPRIKQVIASGHAIEYMKSMPPMLRKLHIWCLNHCPGFMNKMAVLKFEKREGMASWMVDHLKYITKKSKPLEALDLYLQLNEENMHSESIKQDVLILTSRNDHFVPFKMHEMQLKALVHAKSVTGKVFRKEENAENHCQTGNIKLALETMNKWIEDKSS